MFDERILSDLRNPYRRIILREALKLDTDQTVILKQGTEWLSDLLDVLFVTLIKHLPAFSKEHAQAINRLKSIVNQSQRRKGAEGQQEEYLIFGDKMVKVVGEIDDSELEN